MEADPRVLAIGGSDPAGNTGIQTDVRTLTRVGVEATAVVTALAAPAANVFAHPGRAYAAAIRDQMASLRGVEIDAVKTGVLPTEEVVAAVARALEELGGVPVVVDIVTSGGQTGERASQATIDAIRFDLLPLATLVVATLEEAHDLTGTAVDPAGAILALLDMGPAWALIKGASSTSTEWEDLLSDGEQWYSLRTPHVGVSAADAGATFAAALTAALAQGHDVPRAAATARQFVVDETGQSPNGDIRALRHIPKD